MSRFWSRVYDLREIISPFRFQISHVKFISNMIIYAYKKDSLQHVEKVNAMVLCIEEKNSAPMDLYLFTGVLTSPIWRRSLRTAAMVLSSQVAVCVCTMQNADVCVWKEQRVTWSKRGLPYSKVGYVGMLCFRGLRYLLNNVDK